MQQAATDRQGSLIRQDQSPTNAGRPHTIHRIPIAPNRIPPRNPIGHSARRHRAPGQRSAGRSAARPSTPGAAPRHVGPGVPALGPDTFGQSGRSARLFPGRTADACPGVAGEQFRPGLARQLLNSKALMTRPIDAAPPLSPTVAKGTSAARPLARPGNTPGNPYHLAVDLPSRRLPETRHPFLVTGQSSPGRERGTERRDGNGGTTPPFIRPSAPPDRPAPATAACRRRAACGARRCTAGRRRSRRRRRHPSGSSSACSRDPRSPWPPPWP